MSRPRPTSAPRIGTRSTRAMPAVSSRAWMRSSKRRGSDMYELGVVYRNIRRADRAAADGLAAPGSATVHEAMGRVGLLKPYMRPIYPGVQVSGTAVPVL